MSKRRRPVTQHVKPSEMPTRVMVVSALLLTPLLVAAALLGMEAYADYRKVETPA
jgi:hypothetical protein